MAEALGTRKAKHNAPWRNPPQLAQHRSGPAASHSSQFDSRRSEQDNVPFPILLPQPCIWCCERALAPFSAAACVVAAPSLDLYLSFLVGSWSLDRPKLVSRQHACASIPVIKRGLLVSEHL